MAAEVSGETLLMAEMEEQSGKCCWRWRGSNTEQGKKIWEQWLSCWTWQFPGRVGLGDTFQLTKEDIAGALWVLRALEACAVRRMCGGVATDQGCIE